MSRKMTLSLLVGLVAAATLASAEAPRSLEAAVQEARALTRDRLFEGAEIVLTEALEEHSRDEDVGTSLDALWLLGVCRSIRGDYDGAAAAYRERLELLTKHSAVKATLDERQTLQVLAEAYDNAGRGDEARGIWMRLAEIGRKDPRSWSLGIAYSAIAHSFAREGRHEEAREYFDKALAVLRVVNDTSTLFVTLNQYADLLRELGETDRANELEQRAHALMAKVVRSSDGSSIEIQGNAEILREWPPPDWENGK